MRRGRLLLTPSTCTSTDPASEPLITHTPLLSLRGFVFSAQANGFGAFSPATLPSRKVHDAVLPASVHDLEYYKNALASTTQSQRPAWKSVYILYLAHEISLTELS